MYKLKWCEGRCEQRTLHACHMVFWDCVVSYECPCSNAKSAYSVYYSLPVGESTVGIISLDCLHCLWTSAIGLCDWINDYYTIYRSGASFRHLFYSFCDITHEYIAQQKHRFHRSITEKKFHLYWYFQSYQQAH